jgi:hypothetical protein
VAVAIAASRILPPARACLAALAAAADQLLDQTLACLAVPTTAADQRSCPSRARLVESTVPIVAIDRRSLRYIRSVARSGRCLLAAPGVNADVAHGRARRISSTARAWRMSRPPLADQLRTPAPAAAITTFAVAADPVPAVAVTTRSLRALTPDGIVEPALHAGESARAATREAAPVVPPTVPLLPQRSHSVLRSPDKIVELFLLPQSPRASIATADATATAASEQLRQPAHPCLVRLCEQRQPTGYVLRLAEACLAAPALHAECGRRRPRRRICRRDRCASWFNQGFNRCLPACLPACLAAPVNFGKPTGSLVHYLAMIRRSPGPLHMAPPSSLSGLVPRFTVSSSLQGSRRRSGSPRPTPSRHSL